MKSLFSKSALLLVLASAFALAGCGGSSSKAGDDNGGDGGGDGGGGGDTSTSYRQFVRDAYAQAPSDMPLTVNDKEFTFDVMDTAEFNDLVQGGTIDGGS
ncbi:hypothetical protein [Pseudidiomarina homiensis]|uniref:hypothetical protein n=1 Tax=Pseudidiomarina homiensis TaxID=364198 RepID=UPI00215A6CA4|nr:hypothetical protein [Pseudidiomarina homiensis]